MGTTLRIYSLMETLWALPMTGGGKPLQLTSSPTFPEDVATLSPDGRWIAYQSNESTGVTSAGQGDIFVQSFLQGSFRRQVSIGGGLLARWSADGKELFYMTPNEA